MRSTSIENENVNVFHIHIIFRLRGEYYASLRPPSPSLSPSRRLYKIRAPVDTIIHIFCLRNPVRVEIKLDDGKYSVSKDTNA